MCLEVFFLQVWGPPYARQYVYGDTYFFTCTGKCMQLAYTVWRESNATQMYSAYESVARVLFGCLLVLMVSHLD